MQICTCLLFAISLFQHCYGYRHPGDYLEMMRDFELVKRKVSMETDVITVRLPVPLKVGALYITCVVYGNLKIVKVKNDSWPYS